MLYIKISSKINKCNVFTIVKNDGGGSGHFIYKEARYDCTEPRTEEVIIGPLRRSTLLTLGQCHTIR